jgi:predicted ArsR family transcriptional regulator
MSPERDDFSGRYTEEYPDSEFLRVVSTLGSCSTSDVAEQLGCSSDLAYRRLRQLDDDGRVNSEKIAGTLRWYPENES